MNCMKKYFFVMAAFTMLLGFSACGNSNKKQPKLPRLQLLRL